MDTLFDDALDEKRLLRPAFVDASRLTEKGKKFLLEAYERYTI